MKLTVLGVGEAFDEELGNTSILVDAETSLLLDCGFAVPQQMWRRFPAAIPDAIYITHAHADHYFGLPALFGRMCTEERREPLAILAQPEDCEKVRKILELAYPGTLEKLPFDLSFVEVSPGRKTPFRGYELNFAPTRHSAALVNLAVRVRHGAKSVCLSGDGVFTAESRALYRGTDILFHEAYSLAPHPNHGVIEDVIRMAEQEGVRKLALTHIERGIRRGQGSVIEQIRKRAAIPVLMPEAGDEFFL
jgi:ribonuclease BN (tRNA processing enzyme)